VKKAALAGIIAAILLASAWYFRRSSDEIGDATAARARPPANVLLITLDTTRADRLGAYGYSAARTPNLDALARGGVRFDDATAPAPITGPSHTAILTGVQPARLGVRDNATTPLPDSALTIAEMLSPRGFATGGFVGAFILDRPYGFAQGFETFDGGFTRVDPGTEANAERPANAVVDDALRWLDAVPAGRPFFAWVHLYDPHVTYRPPAPFPQDYDGEIAFVDQQIGRLLTAVRSRNALGETLIIVAGDHGESLGEHGEDEHGVFLYDAVLRVPLIVFGPGLQRGQVVTGQVRLVDIVPTILDALGGQDAAGALGGRTGVLVAQPFRAASGVRTESAFSPDGESLLPLLAGGTRTTVPASYSESHYPRLHYGWSELRAVRADGWKAIDAPKPELYNLRQDPTEQHNLYNAQRGLADRMIGEAARLGRELAGTTTAAARQPDRETLERLRSLGYVGTASTLPSGTRGPDPKDRIAERREYQALMSTAIDDLRGGRPAAALPKFRRLLEINARAYDLHQFLGEAYERLGRPDDALAEYAYAAILNPESVTPLVAAAEVHLKRGDIGKAQGQLAAAAKVDPQAYEVLMLTGRILEHEKRDGEALDAYDRAVARNVANPHARTQVVAIASRTGRWDVAERHLEALLRMEYQPSRTHFALGRVAQIQGKSAEAAAHYREALRLEPGLPMAVEGLRSLGVK
jgi:arylsulfatase A-like enzyme/Tfp pilus assembly protein PilF